MQRLGKNNGGYFGERIDIAAVLGEIEPMAEAHGWKRETFLEADGFKWWGLHRAAPTQSPHIYISAGIHGDEPASPLAACRLLRENQWPEGVAITLLPCLNPVGFARGTRENGQGTDLNRDYLNPQSLEIRAHVAWLEKQPSFDLTLCLHEDWESHGFYVYELNPDGRPSLAPGIVAGVSPVCPIDYSPVIEGRDASGGVISPNLDPRTRPLWPESFWLIMSRSRLSYTLEAPSDFPLATRVAALVAGVNAAIQGLTV